MALVSFTANHMKDVTIQKRVAHKQYVPITASIVELDVTNRIDMHAMYEAGTNWEQVKRGFALDMFYEVTAPECVEKLKNEKVYALTTQTSDFNNLDGKKIQGLTIFTKQKGKYNEITALQVNPLANSEKGTSIRCFKNVGKSLVDFMKEVSKKSLIVNATCSSKPFYEKMKFKQLNSNNPFILVLKKNIK